MLRSDNWIRENGINLFNIFDTEQVNPASYDLTLDRQLILLTADGKVEQNIPDYGFVLNPGMAILMSTIEYISVPDDHAANIYLKSSLARSGLDHALAGWVDPGFRGNLTLELHSHRPIRLFYGQRIVQIVFYALDQKSYNPYAGKYQDQRGVTSAR